jgi:ABC-type antimicrobial peptide transport system permease subunit
VVRTVLLDFSWPIAIGLTVGVGAAMFATKLITAFLFQTSPNDPLTLMIATMVLGAVALVAAWIPARLAAQVDPSTALRSE